MAAPTPAPTARPDPTNTGECMSAIKATPTPNPIAAPMGTSGARRLVDTAFLLID